MVLRRLWVWGLPPWGACLNPLQWGGGQRAYSGGGLTPQSGFLAWLGLPWLDLAWLGLVVLPSLFFIWRIGAACSTMIPTTIPIDS